MRKRVMAIVLCLVMVLGFTAIRMPGYAKATATATYTVEADKSQVYRGDTIRFTLYLQQTGSMNTIELKLDFPDGLTYREGSGKLVDGAGDALGEEFVTTLYWGEKDRDGNYYWFLNGFSAYAVEVRDRVALLTFEATVDADAPYGNYQVGVTDDSYVADFDSSFDMTLTPAEITVKEKPVPATGISLDKTELSLVAGTNEKLVATVTPDNSTDKVTWTSSDDKVATVANDGTVQAVGVGTATITATAGAYSATCTVTVTCAHTNKTAVGEKDSTCVDQGWDAYQECEDCGQLFNEAGEEIDKTPFRPLVPHQGGTADCSHKAVCTVCHNEYGDFGDHNYGTLIPAVAAECEAEGMKAHYLCTICNTYFDENQNETTKEALTIDALGHNLGDWESDGTSHWQECSRCNEKFNEGTCTGGEATCVDKAVCKVCGYEYGAVNSDNHKRTEVRDAKEPTCKDAGYTGDTYCLDCTKLVKKGETITATGIHASDKWESEDGTHWQICDTCGTKFNEGTCAGGEATCVDKAVCEVCGHAYGDVNPDNHKNTEVRDAVEATCVDEGYTGDTYCLDCKKLVKEGEVITATGIHASDKWESEDGTHWQICDTCETKFNEGTCAGGEATCVDKAVCEVCGHAYGDVDPDNHKNTEVKDAVKATCAKEGYTGDTYCADCGELIEKGEVLPKVAHDYQNGKCTVCGAIDVSFKPVITAGANAAWQENGDEGLSFTSNAAFADFIKVQVDGKDVDASNYEVKEGSTIVTLKASYLETLSVGKHTLSIVSETGTASAEFTVKATSATDDKVESPQTGDTAYLVFWVSLMGVAAVTLVGVNVYSRKRYNRH